MKNISKVIFIIPFLFIIFTVPILSILNQKTKSTYEFRNYVKFPAINFSSVLKADFYTNISDYVSDHFFERDTMIKLYNYINYDILKSKKIGDTVIGKDGTLLKYYKPTILKDEEIKIDSGIKENVKMLSNLNSYLKNRGINFLFVGAPHQSTININNYPKYFNNIKDETEYKEKQFFSQINSKFNTIDMSSIFNKIDDKESLYFKTDHHWNIDGAYIAYENIINNLKQNYPNIEDPLEKDQFNIVRKQGTFDGAFSRQLSYLVDTNDTIELYTPKKGYPKYQKIVNGKENNLLVSNINSYGAYMGGDLSECTIKTNRNNLPKILIVGDSFTNALEYLLFPHFNETTSLDFRYLNNKNFKKYVDKYKPDIVLVVIHNYHYSNPEAVKMLLGI